MYVPPREEELHPINKAWRLRRELGVSVSEEKWKRSHNIAKQLIRQIDIIMIDSRPNLDGLFEIGTMWYQAAPDKARHMIDSYNAKLKASRKKLPK